MYVCVLGFSMSFSLSAHFICASTALDVYVRLLLCLSLSPPPPYVIIRCVCVCFFVSWGHFLSLSISHHFYVCVLCVNVLRVRMSFIISLHLCSSVSCVRTYACLCVCTCVCFKHVYITFFFYLSCHLCVR